MDGGSPRGDARPSIELRLGYRFQDSGRLELALTHRSWRREHGGDGDYERLEFLGDAVLGLRVSERLIEVYPAASEGHLTQQRAWVISARHLAVVACRLGLGDELRLSRAEEAIGGRTKPRLLANAIEAVIAAIYLDGGYAAAAAFIDQHVLGQRMEDLVPHRLHEIAYKSALQEWAHAHHVASPGYRLVSAAGPDHEKIFTVEVGVPGRVTASGTGLTRKAAEQSAAGAALRQLGLLH